MSLNVAGPCAGLPTLLNGPCGSRIAGLPLRLRAPALDDRPGLGWPYSAPLTVMCPDPQARSAQQGVIR